MVHGILNKKDCHSVPTKKIFNKLFFFLESEANFNCKIKITQLFKEKSNSLNFIKKNWVTTVKPRFTMNLGQF